MKQFVMLLAAGNILVSLEDIRGVKDRQYAVVCVEEVCKKYLVSKPPTEKQLEFIVEDSSK